MISPIAHAPVATAIQRAAEHLVSLQDPEGWWCAPLTADSTLESDYILLQLWLHPPQAGAWRLAAAGTAPA